MSDLPTRDNNDQNINAFNWSVILLELIRTLYLCILMSMSFCLSLLCENRLGFASVTKRY